MLLLFWWKFGSWGLVKKLNTLLILMAVRYVAISAFSTVLSFIGLQFWTESSLDVLKSDGLITENFIHSGNASRVIELLLGSYATIGLLTNFVLNVFVLLVLCLKVCLLFPWVTFNYQAILTSCCSMNYLKSRLYVELGNVYGTPNKRIVPLHGRLKFLLEILLLTTKQTQWKWIDDC